MHALGETAQDLRHAFRVHRQRPGVAILIVVPLALAIAATTATFALVNAVLLRPLPFHDPDRIVLLWTSNTLNGSREQFTSVANVADWTARARAVADVAMYREGDGPVIGQGTEPEWIEYAFVSANFFALLGRSPAIGRVPTAEEAEQGSHVVVISQKMWRRVFAAAGNVLGRRLDISGVPCDVIGVMPDDFWFPSKRTDLWLPAGVNSRWRASHADRATRFGVALGRVEATSTVEDARREMLGIATELQHQYPEANANLSVNLVRLDEHVNGASVPSMLVMLLGAVTFVLLIAAANVAGLQLARGMARRDEISIRVALGAERRRIVRQLLAESIGLSLVAGGFGLALAAAVLRIVRAFGPRDLPQLDTLTVDLRVGAFAVLLSIGTGILFGLVPALRISRHGAEVRRVSSRTVSSDRSVRRLRAGLVAAECALAVVLLTGAGLLIRSLLAVRGVDPGFGDRAALTAHLRFHTSLSRARRVALYGEAHDRIAALPGVRASGGIGTLFSDSDAPRFGLRAVDGQPPEAREQWTALSWTTISGDYFRAASIPLLRGRHFTSQDRRDAAPVAIVNQTMARRFWPGEDPIGKRFKGFDPRGRDDEWVTVVGVVADVRSRGLEQSPMAQIFEPQTQSLDETENLVVSASASQGLSEAIRASIAALDRTAVVSDFSTLGGLLDEQSSQRRFETYALSGFATLALVLAAAGIFTLVHYSVSQRTREIGIRLALGARSRDVTAMIVGDGMRTAALGIIIGLAGSLALTRVLSSVLFGVTALDPVTFLTVTALLLLLALSACWAPASRAARANPVVALRPE